MKKTLVCLLVFGMIIGLFTACAAPETSSVTTATTTTTTITLTTTTVTDTTTTTAIVPMGGDNWDYSRRYLLDFSIEGSVSSLLDKEEYQAWCDTFEHYDKGGKRNKYDYNLYTLIHEFSIPREKIEEICRFHAELFPEDEYLTKEQLDVLYTGTEVEVYQYFANPYAVLVGKEAYPPKWLVEHTAEEYAAEGITYAIMSEKMDKMLSVCSEKEQEYLRTQLAALKVLEEPASK